MNSTTPETVKLPSRNTYRMPAFNFKSSWQFGSTAANFEASVDIILITLRLKIKTD